MSLDPNTRRLLSRLQGYADEAERRADAAEADRVAFERLWWLLWTQSIRPGTASTLAAAIHRGGLSRLAALWIVGAVR